VQDRLEAYPGSVRSEWQLDVDPWNSWEATRRPGKIGNASAGLMVAIRRQFIGGFSAKT
jgi:hypothetical protein